MPTITVAIVTARTNEQTSFADWHKVRREFLNRRFSHKLLQGEFGALVACVMGTPADHVCYQIRALAAGTRQPDKVLVIDRTAEARGTATALLQWCPPMLSVKELELYPETALSGAKRPTGTSFGCSDKNTAIVLCDTDVLVMIDDCCLPSFGLVEAVHRCFLESGTDAPVVMPLQHQKIYLRATSPYAPVPSPEPYQLDCATANWTVEREVLTVVQAKERRRVLGVWAMPTKLVRTYLNGYNTKLDGNRVALDEELLERCDRYLQHADGKYVFDPAARLYEIDHSMPWKDLPREPWQKLCPAAEEPSSWRAPGSSLTAMAAGAR